MFPWLQAVANKMKSRLQAPDAHEVIMDMKSEVHIIIAHDHFHRFMSAIPNVDLAEATQ